MADKKVQIGRSQAHYSARGDRILKYSLEIYHPGLKEHKLITAPELHMVETKAGLQIAKWEAQWGQIEQKRELREKKVADAQEAERQTAEAHERLQELEGVLKYTLDINDAIDWESLKVKDHFSEQKPKQHEAPEPRKCGPKPELTWPQFARNYTLFEKLFKGRKAKKDESTRAQFQAASVAWEKVKSETDAFNESEARKHQADLTKWIDACSEWEQRKTEFYKEQERFNSAIDQLRENYQKHEQNAVEQYCEMVLNNSKYPEIISKDFELLYNPETKILICEYFLPDPDNMPKLREVRYIASRGELKQSFITDAQADKMYDTLIYQIVLRTIHELVEADAAGALEAISLNGRVRFISKATGKAEEACIVSIQVKKEQFVEIDLKNVDPKTCFKMLKGIGSSKLHGITPVKPVLEIDRNDRRFVEGHTVADSLEDSTNIAAMDWEEFEHLIRELFEKEFSQNGGEVKITQASRDGGVDAVAFDPDPIRGGKIVIQAKRYTNTVGVSAVRDLYGTVVNEGATKGILVTTADYGPDAYDFAKNKPLTLLSGGNLLHLLEKHGHRVRIDLREAKQILGEKVDQR
jgi:restriction system protein